MTARLPDGWMVLQLSEMCHVEMGQSPPSSTYNNDGKGLPFFQGKAEFGSLYPTASKWCSRPSKVAEPDDVLISVRAPVGPTNLASEKCCIGRGLAALRPLKETLPKFVLYQLRSRERDLDSLGTGTTFKAISGRVLRTFPLRWAPEQVQEEIVSKIDQLFSDLDAGVAALARAKANLARYRAAVLKAAVEGRLRVGPYRSLSYRSSGQALADGADGRDHEALWPTLTLGDLSEFVTSGSRGWSRYYSERGAMFIRSQDISQDRLDLSRVARVQLPHTSVEGARTRVQEGDVLITITGANVTRVAYVDGSIGEAYVSQHVALVRPHSPKSGSFLHLVLRSPTIRRRLLQLAYGAGKPGLNLDQLRQLSLPAPPLSEQSRTFRAVSRFEEAVERLAAVIAVAGIRSRALRAGVLVHAFAGRLT